MPAVDQLAAERAGVEPPGELVRKTREDAFANLAAPSTRALGDVQTLGPGDLQELLEERPDLPRRLGVDAQPAAGLEREAVAGPA